MNKIIYYRDNCIGCSICFEQQPQLWRMSRADGKATLIKSLLKKNVFILNINRITRQETEKIAQTCPVKIIKLA